MDRWIKKYVFGDEAQQLLLEGVKKQAELVGCTLGPSGQFVAIARPFGPINATKDGVTVAKDCIFEGIPGVGARMAVEAAAKTAEVAGDGTTTSTVLIERMFSLGIEAAKTHKVTDLKKGMQLACDEVCNVLLPQMTKKVHGSMVDQVGTISANGDAAIGKLIADAMRRAGRTGVITVEQSKDAFHHIDTTDGFQFSEGYITPEFITDPDRMESVLTNPYILLLDRPLVSLQGFTNFLNAFASQGRPLLILCEELGGEALPTFVYNKQKSAVLSCVVKIPLNLGDKVEFLKDVAAYTGATAVTMESGISVEKINFGTLGQADKVVVGKSTTTIYGGRGAKDKIDYRISQIRGFINGTEVEVEREKLQERLSKLSGGLTTIKIGSVSEIEMKEKLARVEDAMFATRCAVDEGIVMGGGFALGHCAQKLRANMVDAGIIDQGILLVAEAMEEPCKLIARHAGYEEEAKALLVNNGGLGLNCVMGEMGDMVKMGVIDPVKVVRAALQNAVSVAQVLLSTKAVILDIQG